MTKPPLPLQLPFKTTARKKTVIISDGNSSLEVPYYGSPTINESTISTNVRAENPNANNIEILITVVYQFCIHRFGNENPAFFKLSQDEFYNLLKSEDNVKVSFSFIKLLYEFFKLEEMSWQPNSYILSIDGQDGQEVAEPYAKANKYVVCKRSDSSAIFVFANKSELEAQNQFRTSIGQQLSSASEETRKSLLELYKEVFEWEILVDYSDTEEKK